MVRYSFLVRLFHPLLHADLSRRIPDHSVRPDQNIWRNRQADLLRRFEIDDEFKLHRLLDGQVCRRPAFQNLVHIRRGAPVQVEKVHAVKHKTAGFYKLTLVVYRREPVLCREICNLCSLRSEDGAVQREDCLSTPLLCGSERSLNILGI